MVVEWETPSQSTHDEPTVTSATESVTGGPEECDGADRATAGNAIQTDFATIVVPTLLAA